ncbi:oxidoreductase-like protein [Angomonas deanei]|nr:oxidoreductase-like protein [Angomonas deanei]|eukprot:EPY32085.1 oxidoreductase-like protein [Angomonas deanei]
MDQRQLLFMDGTMLSHSRRVKEVNATLKELGRPVQYINVHFTFNGGEDFVAKDIRLNPVLEPQGCLGDVGWYCVRYILHLMGEAMPSEVSGRVIRRDGEHKGIVEFSGEITFDVNGQLTVASLFCGFDACCQHTLTAFTPDASVVLKDFAHPVVGQDATYYVVRDKANATSATDRHSWREEEAHTVKDESTNSQRYDMWRHILDILYPVEEEGGRRLKAKEEESRHWATLTWKTQAVLDKLLESALIAEQQAAQ